MPYHHLYGVYTSPVLVKSARPTKFLFDTRRGSQTWSVSTFLKMEWRDTRKMNDLNRLERRPLKTTPPHLVAPAQLLVSKKNLEWVDI